MTNIKSSRENNFALLHIIAACMVIFGHMFDLLRLPAPTIMNSGVHSVGVNILFVISGYLVAKSFIHDSSIPKFYFKRLTRIYPPLIICVVICAIVAGFFSDYDWNVYLMGAKRYIADNLLMRPRFDLPGIFEGNPYPYSVNGSLWTLPLELALFLLLPFIMIVLNWCKKSKPYCAFMLAILTSVAAVYVEKNMAEKIFVFWATDWLRGVRLAAYFMWGIAFSTLDMDEIKKNCRSDVAVLILGLILCLDGYYQSAYNYFVLPYLVISFAFAGGGILRNFFNRHDYAYGLYLWAFPVQQTLISQLQPWIDISVWSYFFLSLGATTVLAMLTSKFVEEPVQKITSKILNWLALRNISKKATS